MELSLEFINLVVRFFLNLAKKSHLRGIASETNESTNSIRLELNNLTKAGYLIKRKENNKINYLANKNHHLFSVLVSLVKKHTGKEEIVIRMTNSIKNLKSVSNNIDALIRSLVYHYILDI